jgi:hypothetical protein
MSMTPDEHREIVRSDDELYLVVGALADGEALDPVTLRAALEDPAIRDYLVDLIALRQAVRTVSELPAARWRERGSFRSRVGWLSAAAAIVISLTGGYFAGQRTVQAAPAPIVETVVHLGNAGAAPKPTRVISLRPGVNWTETAGAQ